MKRKWFLPVFLCCLGLLSALPGLKVRAAEEEILDRSGASALYDVLDEETKELLDRVGVENVGEAGNAQGIFPALSALLREKLTGPVKALASLTAVAILCRLAACFGSGEISGTAALGSALACAVVVVTPLLGILRNAGRVVESASAFLLAAVPVYGGLMAAAGAPAAGTSYSFLTLAAGNVIPILASSVVFPALHVFLGLGLVSAVSQLKLDRLAKSLYSFVKWLLVLAVTAFSGVLSVQAALNAKVDAAAAKAAKLLASTAIPIVGSAFGDAVGAIRNSVQLVKSGVGAFGMLAALCIFLPAMLEALLWSGVCAAGQLAGDLFESPRLSAMLGMCASAVKMVLAVLAAVCIISVVSGAIVLFVGGEA